MNAVYGGSVAAIRFARLKEKQGRAAKGADSHAQLTCKRNRGGEHVVNVHDSKDGRKRVSGPKWPSED